MSIDKEFYKMAIIENIATLLAAIICIVGIAFATGSLHCLWGLSILLNINFIKNTTKK